MLGGIREWGVRGEAYRCTSSRIHLNRISFDEFVVNDAVLTSQMSLDEGGLALVSSTSLQVARRQERTFPVRKKKGHDQLSQSQSLRAT